jgi:hypothetical protein
MKFFGKVGYGTAGETQNGTWVDKITERSYYGDVEKDARRLVSGERLNDDITVSNNIRIIADPYALEHFHAIKYVEWAGALYKVTDVEVQSPRLLLRLGGVYNGQTEASNPLRRDTGE